MAGLGGFCAEQVGKTVFQHFQLVQTQPRKLFHGNRIIPSRMGNGDQDRRQNLVLYLERFGRFHRKMDNMLNLGRNAGIF
jgi:hypothetical protein